MELRGKYGTAKVFGDIIDIVSVAQLIELLNQEFTDDQTIRIMPDVHAGKGCVIGTTMTIGDKIVPNLVGVDIGCGVSGFEIHGDMDFEKLDRIIRTYIPSGFSVRDEEQPGVNFIENLYCKDAVGISRAKRSVGTLGGGNHFIEVAYSTKYDNKFLLVHTGSRQLGTQVAKYYQAMAEIKCSSRADEIAKVIAELRAQKKFDQISDAIAEIKRKTTSIPKDLMYLEGQDKYDYLHDMEITQNFASFNRTRILYEIMERMGWTYSADFHSVHNYCTGTILRKGAISAFKGDTCIIPLNMRDGSLLCVGKSNPEWNYSAPHGAGRIMSRSMAKQNLSMGEYQETMEGIWTTSVSSDTLDEAPAAYKPYQSIIDAIGDTVDVVDRIVPIYNFKAGGD
jgi:tRNA-splicing ligase RtcB (3'-phosphate/5'-hydroxy nucleic acid ligase)